jgi:hypothetical protein
MLHKAQTQKPKSSLRERSFIRSPRTRSTAVESQTAPRRRHGNLRPAAVGAVGRHHGVARSAIHEVAATLPSSLGQPPAELPSWQTSESGGAPLMADWRPPAELERGGGGRAPPVSRCPHPRPGAQEEDDDAVDREADGGGFAVVMARRWRRTALHWPWPGRAAARGARRNHRLRARPRHRPSTSGVRLSAAELTRGHRAVGCGAHARCLAARCLVARSSSARGLRYAIGGSPPVAAQRD